MQFLIHSDNTFVKLSNLSAIIDLLLGVEIDCTSVDAELVSLEEWDGCIEKVQVNDLRQDVGAFDLSRLVLDAVVK